MCIVYIHINFFVWLGNDLGYDCTRGDCRVLSESFILSCLTSYAIIIVIVIFRQYKSTYFARDKCFRVNQAPRMSARRMKVSKCPSDALTMTNRSPQQQFTNMDFSTEIDLEALKATLSLDD